MSRMHSLLEKLIRRRNLTAEEARDFLTVVMRGEVPHTLIAAILTALRMKGETTNEIVGFVRAMREQMVHVSAPNAIDVVGTGGDGTRSTGSGQGGTFNISTTAAFVVAGAGVKVAKHGNRAASSKCGSADVLEALGVNVQLTKEQAENVFKKVGMVFMLAPLFHPSTKEVVMVRKELKVRTIFNFLGPLANPASATCQLMGVPTKEAANMLAAAAKKLGYKRLLIVSSEDGMDEVSLTAKTYAYDVRGSVMCTFTIDPRKFGFKKASKKDMLGGDAHMNAGIIRAVLGGKRGPHRDVVLLNSACALYVAGAAKSIKEGIHMAERSIESGAAKDVLECLIRETGAFVRA